MIMGFMEEVYGGGGPAFSPRHSPIKNMQSKVKGHDRHGTWVLIKLHDYSFTII